MAALATILPLVSAVLAAVATFLYNDGHNHTLAVKVSGGISALSLPISWLALDQQWANEGADCTLYNKGCDKSDSLMDLPMKLMDGMMVPMIGEMILVLCCAAAGWVVAKLTSRQRADGRSMLVLPW